MRPTKLSSNVFLELPPILAHYLETDRNLWIEGNPKRGRLSLLNRSGNFVDLESMAVERRHLMQILGMERARALQFRMGFERGRRDGARHYQAFGENARLALQAALVFGQLQGRFVAETIRFEFDLEARTLYRELVLESCVEAVIHQMTLAERGQCVCWGVAGYLSGHVSEILNRRVVTLETECVCQGAEGCRFITRLDPEWGKEAAWVRKAMRMDSLDDELHKRDALIASAQKAARRAQTALNDLNRRMRSDLLMDSIIVDSEAMQPVVDRIRQLTVSDAPVLLTGEGGTGKETLARSIHFGGARKRKPFIVVDCAGLTDQLLAQELFGYEREVSPGATHSHKGALVRANGGAVYLSAVTEMSVELQGKLLRTMGEGKVQVPGAEKAVKADVRVFASTQKDPLEEVEGGALREDFYYALAVGRVDLPPLRERGTDVLRLAESFFQEFKERHRRQGLTMTEPFKQVLLDCAWPGNLGQLRNVIEHAIIMAQEDELAPANLPEEILATRRAREPQALTEAVIRAALKRTHNSRSQAAEILGVGRTTLWRAMKRLSIE